MCGFPQISRSQFCALLLAAGFAAACGDQVGRTSHGVARKAHGARPGTRSHDGGVNDASGDARVDARAPPPPEDAGSPLPEGGGGSDSSSDTNSVAVENQRVGTTDWQITEAAANHQVEGYASAASAGPGEVVTLFISTSEARSVRWELYRLGYYGGDGARLVAVSDPMSIAPQGP